MGTRTNRKDFEGNGHWIWNGEPLGSGKNFGFIYVIRDCLADKLYLGKKQFKGRGALNKGQESNWMWYTSSSKELNERIKTCGKDNFEFIAIEQYVPVGTLSYAETWSLMHVESPTNRDKWYNLLVNKVSWPVKVPISERHKKRLSMVLNNEPFIMEYVG